MSKIPPAISEEFPLDETIIHLNHAAVGPWPLRTQRAVCDFAAENCHVGSRHYLRWVAKETELRGQLARLINAPAADDIALLKNTSEGLSVIAYGLPWRRGDNIVISDEEFPSNRIVWESLQDQGVTVRQVDITGEDPEEAMLSACDGNTRLLSVSSVQYASGRRLELSRLGSFCRQKDILFCVDAIQSIGAIPFDCQAVQADFVVADGHKWMLGPEGLALFYVRPDIRERLALRQFGWHMVEEYGDFDSRDWQPAHSARRFECGSPNMLACHALSASLSLLEEVGMDEVERALSQNVKYLMDKLQNMPGVSLLTPQQDGRFAGIVTFRLDRLQQNEVYQSLMEKGVLCAARGGGIRFSPHFYTPRHRLDEALNRLEELAV